MCDNLIFLVLSETTYLLATPTVTCISELTEEFSVCTSGNREKFGRCRQITTHKNVSGSKLCRRDRGIWVKCDNIWLSGRHVANMPATFSAKVARQQRWRQGRQQGPGRGQRGGNNSIGIGGDAVTTVVRTIARETWRDKGNTATTMGYCYLLEGLLELAL